MKKTSIFLGITLSAVALLTAFSNKKTPLLDPEPTFEEFLGQFPKKSLPYSLDEKSLKSKLEKFVDQVNHPRKETYNGQAKRLEWPYYRFLPDLQNEASFSRLPVQAEALAMFAAGDKVAVVYSTSRSLHFGYATYYLSLFDEKGRQISSNVIGKVMPETILSANISKSLQAELKSWHIDWQKPYEDNGLDGNRITGLTFMESSRLDLNVPTNNRVAPFDKRSILPPDIDDLPQSVENIKSK